jgi:transposase
MSGRIKQLELSPDSVQSLEMLYRHGETHCFRMRCMAVLLKTKGLSSAKAGSLTDMTLASVNHWVRRYQREGIPGLYTRPGQGRKSLIIDTDKESVLAAIKADRQNVQAAKAAWEASSGKTVSRLTFQRFLKSLADDINV